MSYFQDNYGSVRLPIAGPDGAGGLRNAQLGAIHAIASHFTVDSRPALAVLPTGAGKTAVLMVSAFLLRATRVLVITPSTLVREQIAGKFGELDPLRALAVIPATLGTPRVIEVKKRMETPADWEAVRDFDVIVSTPNCVSAAQERICAPPPGLFDLLLIDEAHHSPAKTWQALFDQFSDARALLVTATPFRRDKKEIRGKFVYSYSIKRAHQDGIYGHIEFVAAAREEGVPDDEVVARKAEEVFRRERNDGHNSVLLVRTDSQKRAGELLKIYEEKTGLKLRRVDSSYSKRHVDKALQDLRAGSLDGVVCVDMMGEGVDFPQLKIAAIHHPHKSLEITLQFIGRFARTNDPNAGEAKFIAVPHDIKLETERLYLDRSAWIDIVSNLSDTRVAQQQRTADFLEGFERKFELAPESGEISLYSMKPYFHVMIFRVDGTVSFDEGPKLPPGLGVIDKEVNAEASTCVVIAGETLFPRWTRHERFESEQFHLFVLYHDEASGLLFVNSSLRTDEVSRAMAASCVLGGVSTIPIHLISSVLLDLNDLKFFNVGMRNRAHGNRQESYRTLAGASAEMAISEFDAQLYGQGHVFGKGVTGEGVEVTLGYSSGSKVWMNANLMIPQFIDWCRRFAEVLASGREVETRTPLDLLQKGETIDAFPANIAAIYWSKSTYSTLPQGELIIAGNRSDVSLIDFELRVDRASISPIALEFELSGFGARFRFRSDMAQHGRASLVQKTPADVVLTIDRQGRQVGIERYIEAHPPSLFTDDFSRIESNELIKGPASPIVEFDTDSLDVVDWAAQCVDITREVGDAAVGMHSIQDWLGAKLEAECELVFCDHTAGEIADFITFAESGDYVGIGLYHCKASAGAAPGRRVEDYYEVCGQSIKSLHWLDQKRIRDHISHRIEKVRLRFRAGKTLADLDVFLARTRGKTRRFTVFIVQPGISASDLGGHQQLLASSLNMIRRSKGCELRVMASA